MLYIDGYNLIFRTYYHHSSLQEKREVLIAFLNQKLLKEATVVFDSAKTPGLSSRHSHRRLHVVYTAEGESADDWILFEVKRAKYPSSCMVVTTDKALMRNILAAGGKVVTVEEFLSSLEKKKEEPLTKEQADPRFAFYLKIFEENSL